MKKRYYFLFAIIALILLLVVFSAIPRDMSNSMLLKKYWQEHYTMMPPENRLENYEARMVSKAAIDECFYDVGSDRNKFVPGGIDVDFCRSEGGTPKHNQSYFWSCTEASGKLFYGTVANFLCQNFMNYSRFDSIMNNCLACEWGKSGINMENGFNEFYGDHRPPEAFVFNPKTGINRDLTPRSDTNHRYALGFRVAGSIDGIVFFAAPEIGDKPASISGIRIYAYNAGSEEYLGSIHIDSLLLPYSLTGSNIRRCTNAAGSIYFALAVKDLADDNVEKGAVIRWTGSPEHPFKFELVCRVPEPVYEICLHKNRLYIHTWPSVSMDIVHSENPELTSFSSLYISPILPVDGLNERHIESWQKVWDYSMYEPDKYVWMTYMGGRMLSWNGYLYFGTLHMPMANFLMMKLNREEAGKWEMLNALAGSHRAISIFRCDDFSVEDPDVEIVFGMEKLPVFDMETRRWKLKNNKLNKKPLSGPMGIWNPFNHYAWSMEVYNDMLFIGTKSFFRKVPELLSMMSNRIVARLQNHIDTNLYIHSGIVEVNGLYVPADWLGGDVFCLKTSSDNPFALTTDGFNNQYNYGIRAMTCVGDQLYMGTANPYNLAEDGGYEVYEISRSVRSSVASGQIDQ